MDNSKRAQNSLEIKWHINSIHTALVGLVLLAVGLLIYLMWGSDWVTAAAEPAENLPEAPLSGSTGLRLFYITDNYITNGSEADDLGCAEGYHLASFWEISDPSNLQYNDSLGLSISDSGLGPPSGNIYGWVGTGYLAAVNNTSGQANCNAWTSSSPNDYGTIVGLDQDWSTKVAGWHASTDTCDQYHLVWCVED